jgi:hypothetical protein
MNSPFFLRLSCGQISLPDAKHSIPLLESMAAQTKNTYVYIVIFSLFLLCLYVNSPIIEEYFYPHVSTSIAAQRGNPRRSASANTLIILFSVLGGLGLLLLGVYFYFTYYDN